MDGSAPKVKGDYFMRKEALVKSLMEKDEVTIATAILYAESYLKYGVDVCKVWETAVQNTVSLHQAERAGYIEGCKTHLNIVRCHECKWRNTNACFCKAPKDVQDKWFCSEGERREEK